MTLPLCRGFSSPGNAGISEEMKEAGRPDEVRRNEEGSSTCGLQILV